MTLLKVQIPLTVVVEVSDCQGPAGYHHIGVQVKDKVKDILHSQLPSSGMPYRPEWLEWGRVEVTRQE
jgi:hypothetical protein